MNKRRKDMLKKMLLILAVVLLTATGCSDEKPAAEEMKASSGSISEGATEPSGAKPSFSGEAVLSALAPFGIAGYDNEPGDFSHQFTLTDAQQSELEKLLRADRWKEITELPEHGFTTFLRAINPDGYHMAIGEWSKENSFVTITISPGSEESTWYLAPREVVEDAKLFCERLKEEQPVQEEAQKISGKAVGTEFEIDGVKFKLALPEGWTATGNEVFVNDVKIAELLSFVPNGDGKAFELLDKQYTDAVAVKDVTAGTHSGKYYHMQSETAVGGVTTKQNELLYYLEIKDSYLEMGNSLLHFAFYPLHGIGIGTQREEFEAVLNTIGFHP